MKLPFSFFISINLDLNWKKIKPVIRNSNSSAGPLKQILIIMHFKINKLGNFFLQKIAYLTKLFLNWVHSDFKRPIYSTWIQFFSMGMKNCPWLVTLVGIRIFFHSISSKLFGSARMVMCFFYLEKFLGRPL